MHPLCQATRDHRTAPELSKTEPHVHRKQTHQTFRRASPAVHVAQERHFSIIYLYESV